MEDQEIIALIAQVKKNGQRVFKAKIAGIECIYRSLGRKECRDLQKHLAEKTEAIRQNSEPAVLETKLGLLKEEGEEELFIKAILYPKAKSSLDLVSLPAGIIPSVAELIMGASGFGEDVTPQEI